MALIRRTQPHQQTTGRHRGTRRERAVKPAHACSGTHLLLLLLLQQELLSLPLLLQQRQALLARLLTGACRRCRADHFNESVRRLLGVLRRGG